MVEETIRQSEWWRVATGTPDRHYPDDAGVSLADHLEAVAAAVDRLLVGAIGTPYIAALREALERQGLPLPDVARRLRCVALLHDIGKPREDKQLKMAHPVTGREKPARHPLVGVVAACELLPQDLAGREELLVLIEEHDTPYSWYRQFQASGVVPAKKAWGKLGRKIDAQQEARGLVLLCIFKLADIHGHDDRQDVVWFIENANRLLLDEQGWGLPLPSEMYFQHMGE